uniref:OTU domain-containing protein n=1 Tax=Wolbachia endosymbiont of Aleurodicus floccissimus TaxID=2152762 RepID=A0A3B0J0U0_9RICK
MAEFRKRKLPNDFYNAKRRKVLESGVEEEFSNSKIVKYSTTGDGNCFFHAVFGVNSSGTYKAQRAQDMRVEWHKFLSQFTSLDDVSMPAPLRAQLEKVFNMFLNKPEDLTGKSDKIEKLVEQTNRKIENAEDNVKRLVSKAISKLNVSHNQAMLNLKEYAEALNGHGEDEYGAQYNSEFITHSFLNNSELYQAYLEAIEGKSYFPFIEEVQILASLANMEISVHYEVDGREKQQKFEPKPEMINDDEMNKFLGRDGYKINDELWGSKERETIYLEGNHYSRAKIVTQELIKQQQEHEDFLLAKQLQIDEILEYCNLSKDISERAEVEKRFDELLAGNADGKIGDVVGQCINDVQQRIKCLEEPVLSRRCSVEEAHVEKAFHQQQQILAH